MESKNEKIAATPQTVFLVPILVEPIALIFKGMMANFSALSISFQYGCAILLGLFVGNFLSVVVHRLPIMLKWQTESNNFSDSTNLSAHGPLLFRPRSYCPSCQRTLTLLENLPILGYFLCRGRCTTCHTSISLRYPALELLSACLAVIVLWHFGASLQALAAFGLIVTLLALALIDMDTYLLPDLLTLPLIWAGLLINLNTRFTPLPNAVIGALTGYLILWLVSWMVRLLCGKDGIGYGDFKLLAALGAWFGWMALPQILLVATTTGTLFIFIGMTNDYLKKEQYLPFGPFLAAAGIFVLFCDTPFY